MSQLFTDGVATLIGLTESKPCLWDRTSDSYKDKIEKLKAWMEMCAFLERDFHQMDRKQQHKIRYKSTSKLRFLFLCTNNFLVQRSK
jgi:hypothetical protein